jgi:hypothetical protein
MVLLVNASSQMAICGCRETATLDQAMETAKLKRQVDQTCHVARRICSLVRSRPHAPRFAADAAAHRQQKPHNRPSKVGNCAENSLVRDDGTEGGSTTLNSGGLFQTIKWTV